MTRNKWDKPGLATMSRPGILTLLGVMFFLVGVADIRAASSNPVPVKGQTLMSPKVEMRLDGEMGRRVEANVENWLLTAPEANPGMLEMMRLRDRQPDYENPVPWAGEFIGKYLISAVQAVRMSDNPELRPFVAGVFADLIATQADDGYLGPFRKDERLLSHWDLWGHYHVMLALYKWHKDTGNPAALEAALKAADLVCKTYLDQGKTVYDAGSYEMNMAIGHIMAILYRETGRERYLKMSLSVLEDWERPGAGDYLRQALKGVEYYRTPRPRWESLHSIESLNDLYLATGNEDYREALLFDWRSILKTDVHNYGGFSTNEQAVGNPFSPGPIETCCTVAWIALGIDALRLSSDSTVADELERSTWNAVLAYQHPSGRWSTYDTPMDGKRLASAHSIVFQSRPGTPELNCCSVNAPRGLGMISEWGVLADEDGLFLNYYGPGKMAVASGEWDGWSVTQETAYPADGKIEIVVKPSAKTEAALHLRIPGWSASTGVLLNGEPVTGVKAGQYLTVERTWAEGDRIELTLDMSPRLMGGDERVGLGASLFIGSLLMAYDQKFNAFDPADIPAMDAQSLDLKDAGAPPTWFEPMLFMQAKGVDGRTLNLCDFATAGACGTFYKSWLPMSNLPPAPFSLGSPRSGRKLPVRPVTLTWKPAGGDVSYDVTVATDPAMEDVAFEKKGLGETSLTLDPALATGRMVYWTVTASNAKGRTEAMNGPQSFMIDPSIVVRGDGLLLDAGFDGTTDAKIGGKASVAENVTLTADRFGRPDQACAFNGENSRLVYAVDGFPAGDYTAMAWIRPEPMPESIPHQIFSGWCAGMDDPLRFTVIENKLVGIIEAGSGFGTAHVNLDAGQWYHVAMVKDMDTMILYVNGEEAAEGHVPERLDTAAAAIGIGCNPLLPDRTESFRGAIDEAKLFERALSPEEVRKASQTGQKP